MERKDINTNIMLDLECTAIAYNPCIIEIGAVYFDLDTGAELAHFQTPVSLQSCTKVKLVIDQDTINWLRQNIPNTLQTSRQCTITLPEALRKLNGFIESCTATTIDRLQERGLSACLGHSETRVYGNGAIADNVWIHSAYKACKMDKSKPWRFTGDMCVRTLVKSYGDMLGRDFAKEEPFQGSKHDALDDCRHQIRYLVKARNAVMVSGRRTETSPPSDVEKSDVEEAPRQGSKRSRRSSGRVFPSKIPRILPTPENSFSGMERDTVSGVMMHQSYIQRATSSSVGVPRMPITPEQSFSEARTEEEVDKNVCEQDISGYLADSSSTKPVATLLMKPATSEVAGKAPGFGITDTETAVNISPGMGQLSAKRPAVLPTPETLFSGAGDIN